MRDRVAGATRLISTSGSAIQISQAAAISGDARFIGFASTAPDLAAGDSPQGFGTGWDVFPIELAVRSAGRRARRRPSPVQGDDGSWHAGNVDRVVQRERRRQRPFRRRTGRVCALDPGRRTAARPWTHAPGRCRCATGPESCVTAGPVEGCSRPARTAGDDHRAARRLRGRDRQRIDGRLRLHRRGLGRRLVPWIGARHVQPGRAHLQRDRGRRGRQSHVSHRHLLGALPLAGLGTARRRARPGCRRGRRTIPLKFSVQGGSGAVVVAGVQVAAVPCSGNAPVAAGDPRLEPADATINDAGQDGRAMVLWRTSRGYAGSCRQLLLELTDGSVHRLTFEFRPAAHGRALHRHHRR